MKKLVVMLGIALSVVSAKAASANWMVELGVNTYDAWSFYVFNGTDAGTLSGYLTGNKVSDFTTAIAGYTPVSLSEGFAEGGFSDVGDSLSAILFNTTENGATFYYIGSASTDGYTYTPPQPSSGELFWELSNFTTGTVVNTDAVPEPTSGFLLLLGMAGLALKRKRA